MTQSSLSGATIPSPANGAPIVCLPSPPDKQALFSPAQKAMRAEDRQAATAIVVVMVGIFTLALVGYLISAIITFLAFGG